MKALVLTNEYPPNVYGGAGMHVAELTRALRGRLALDVRAFGTQAEESDGWRVRGYATPSDLPPGDERLRPVWDAFARGVAMAADPTDADLVHCHTWYTHLAGLLVQRARGIPLVVTVHSLEPLRPWKREQLGGGYDLSAWVERTALEAADAVIAVSTGTRDDVLGHFGVAPERVTVIHNGIDADFFVPDPATDALERFGIPPGAPYVLFVGRITRQKGIVHLVRAIGQLDPGIGVVMAAGQPDTPELAEEVEAGVSEARATRPNVVWIPEMLSRAEIRQLYSHAALFVCPSVYEPFGLTNLEAMACGTAVVASAVGGIPEMLSRAEIRQLYSHAALFVCPSVYEPFGITNLEAMACGSAVVASAVGGIPEVVVDGETGVLVPLELAADEPMTPVDPDRFAADLATAINGLMADPARRAAMGAAGRRRAVEKFSWASVADRTLELYGSLAAPAG